MEWNADAFFAIGKTHMICQDYAKSGFQQHGLPYAVLSDGCSTSEDTDVGARILCSTTASNMRWIGRECSFQDREPAIIEEARQGIETIKMPLRCLDATLLAAYWSEREGKVGIRVSIRGDGVVVARGRDGKSCIYSIEHTHNAPRYLSYDLEPKRLEAYLEMYGDRSRIQTIISNTDCNEVMEYNGHGEDRFFSASDYDLVMLLSDGVHSFQEKVTTGTSRTLVDISFLAVIDQLLNIRSQTGKFLQRRCHKFLTNFCPLHNWQHADDFSAAAIWMGEPS